MINCQQIEVLLSGYIDGELTHGDRQRVEVHCDACADCRRQFEELVELRRKVGKLSFGEIPVDQWREMMNDAGVRASRGFGWLLYIGGLLLLIGYGGVAFMTDDAVPALIKTGVAAVVVGLALLLFSALRQRRIARKTDRYEDVQI